MNGTTRKVLVGSGLLIGMYLALVHFTGFSTDVNAVGNASGSTVRALQGR